MRSQLLWEVISHGARLVAIGMIAGNSEEQRRLVRIVRFAPQLDIIDCRRRAACGVRLHVDDGDDVVQSVCGTRIGSGPEHGSLRQVAEAGLVNGTAIKPHETTPEANAAAPTSEG
jgi:hypothetical protein